MAKEVLTDVEKLAIEALVTKKRPLSKIVAEINKSKPLIVAYIDELKTKKKAGKPNAKSLMARNKDRGITVMTREASERGDDFREEENINGKPDYSHCIHKIE